MTGELDGLDDQHSLSLVTHSERHAALARAMAETTAPPLCRCVLVDGSGSDRFNQCLAPTSGPDDPMCDSCRAHGHAENPAQLPLSDARRRSVG